MTGGGPPLPPSNNSIDTKLMGIISEVAVSGNPDVQESMVHFDFGLTNEIEITEDSGTLGNQSYEVNDLLFILFYFFFWADVSVTS